MTWDLAYKLLALFAMIAIGYGATRLGVLGGADGQRALASAAFGLFLPALLFRTTAGIDLSDLPGPLLLAFFGPLVLWALAIWSIDRRRGPAHPADPAVRAVSLSFGNTVQVGLPFAAALFGEAGLQLHLAIVSLHALVLLTLLTVLVELDLARDPARHAQAPALLRTLALTARNTVVHPVVLPVLAGLAWNLTGWGLHPVVDESLATLATAVVPVCLVLIGVTLAAYGVRGQVRGAFGSSVLKLLVLPAVVLAVAHLGFGLAGLPLAVVVVFAALPAGSNALIFAQRYETLQAETTATIVLSTVAFAFTASFWIAVLRVVAP